MLRIFLAHAKEDKDPVISLYNRLQQSGYQPWLDEKDLLPGQNWRAEISKVIKDSHVFLACLSHRSVAKEGYVQKEFKMALNEYASKPPGSIYLIPVCLDTCTMPELRQEEYGINLRDIHWVNLFETDGFNKLLDALNSGFPEIHKKQLTPSVGVIQHDVPLEREALSQETSDTLIIDSSDTSLSDDFSFSDFFGVAFILIAPVVLISQVFGGATVIAWIILGLVSGTIARAVYPGQQGLGLLGTIVLGLNGAGVVKLLFHFTGFKDIVELNAAGVTISTLGAIIVLFTYYACTKRVA